MNLVSLIMQFLTPALVGRLASALGINQTVAQKLIMAAVPTILAGLVNKVQQPGGAGALFDMLGKQDPGLLGKLASVIGGQQQKQIAEQGTNVLGALLGNPALGSLTGALTRFTGSAETPTRSLLGMLAPVVLGTLSQQQKSAGLDTGGLSRMLSGQKSNIAAAIPPEFSKLLEGSSLLDGISVAPPKATTPPAKPATAPARPASAPQAASRAPAPVETPIPVARRGSEFNWWPWLILIALSGAIWWYYHFIPHPTRLATLPMPPRIMVGNSDVGAQLGNSLESVRGALASITDTRSAQGALPALRDSQVALDRIAATPDLSADTRRQIAVFVAQWLPRLTPVINQLLANSSYGPILKPVLDTLTKRLEAMANG